jgi:hypothetical protein
MDRHKIYFIILIVIYNKDPFESTTIQCLIDSIYNTKDSRIIIWDNSIIAPSPESVEKLRKYWVNLEYNHTPMNLPLSQIYNCIIGKINDHSTNLSARHKFLLLFDQDSIIDNDYFNILKNSIKNYENIMLFVPRVICNNIYISPGNLFYFKGFYTRNKLNGLISSRNKTAINSGMAISTNYLKHFYEGYNEKLTFYGIDNYFMIKYSKCQEYLYVIDYNMHHQLAKYSVEDVSMTKWRQTNTINSIKVILNEFNLFVRLFGLVYICFLKCKYYVLLRFMSLRSAKR